MFEATLKPQPDFTNKIYDIMFEIANKASEDRDKLNELPYLLSKAQLAKYVFNVSPQTLDAHIIHRADFPKIRIGERILFPKDKAIQWIQAHIDVANDVAPDRKIGVV